MASRNKPKAAQSAKKRRNAMAKADSAKKAAKPAENKSIQWLAAAAAMAAIQRNNISYQKPQP
jgi:hypothetical protein